MIKAINKNEKSINSINGEDLPDYTEDFKKKVNVTADNIGYGEDFEETEDYSIEDNLIDWGSALTNKDNKIEADNEKLVSSQNVYDETHPYMEKDGEGHWINPYHYINYRDLIRDEDIEDINKQDRYVRGDVFDPHTPNDNMVKENLIALDSALYDVAIQMEDKANINLNNLNMDGLSLINKMAMGSIYVQQDPTKQDPLIKVKCDRVQDQQTGLYTDVYTVYTTYDPDEGGGSQPDLSIYALESGKNVGFWARKQAIIPSYISELTFQQQEEIKNWAQALAPTGGNFMASEYIIRAKEAGHTDSYYGSIQPARPNYDVQDRIDNYYLVTSLALVEETRTHMQTYTYQPDGFVTGGSYYPNTTLCFIDDDNSAGFAIENLNNALVKTVKGVNQLWNDLHGNNGEGSPFYEDKNNLNEDAPYTYEVISEDSGGNNQDRSIVFKHGDVEVGHYVPIDTAVSALLTHMDNLVQVYDIKELLVGEYGSLQEYIGTSGEPLTTTVLITNNYLYNVLGPKVSDHENRLKTLEQETIPPMQQKITQHTNSINTINNVLSDINEDIAQIKNDIADIKQDIQDIYSIINNS